MNFRVSRMNFGDRHAPSELTPWLWTVGLLAVVLIFVIDTRD